MEYQITTSRNLPPGCTFSDATDIYKKSGKKNLFEELITLKTIEEDSNLIDAEKERLITILNSNIDPFEKRIRIMRTLDKDKEFSSQIALILKDNLSKMDKVKKVLYVFRDHYIKSDVLKKEFGEVLTPASTVKNMIDEIDPEFWTSPYNDDGSIKRILESSNGSGIFLWGVISKFMIGLKSHFPDENSRYKFIVENMIYACELQKSKMFHWICIADLYDEYDLNVYCGSFLEDGFDKHMKEVWGVDRFSLCLSNPPYQEEVIGGSQKPLYNKFIMKADKISIRILFITPSRWFIGGKGLDQFRSMMLNRKDIRIINHFNEANKIFGPGVYISGGVNYFLIDREYSGDVKINGSLVNIGKYDILIKNVKYYNLIDKISINNGLNLICKGQSYSGITTNDYRLKKVKINDDYIKCYVSKRNGYEKWIHRDELKKNTLSKWKVITAEATNADDISHGSYSNFGNKFIGKPNEICNQSYVVFEVNTEAESISLLSYLNTKFANKLLSIRKTSQHIKPDTCKWIPMVPFDREWTDEKLFDYFKLTENEKKLINE